MKCDKLSEFGFDKNTLAIGNGGRLSNTGLSNTGRL